MIMFPQHCKTIIWCTIYVISLSLRRKCPLKVPKRQLWILYVYFTVVPSVWAALLSADFITSDWISPALCKFLLLHCKLVNFTLDHLIWLFDLSGQTVDNDDSWHRPVDNCIALLWLSYFMADREAYIKAWITKSYQRTLNHLSPKTLQSELRWRTTEGNAKNLSSK